MIFFIFFLVIFLAKKYELKKEQIHIFIILVLFWTSISIIRAYRKLYIITPVEEGGLSLSLELAAKVASGYGIMSLLVRLPMFVASDYFRKRKIFVQLALISLIASSFLVFYSPTYSSLYISSLAIGLCATMLAMFNVIFQETFSINKVAVSVAILSAAPLLAEFIAAPVQYIFTYSQYKHYNLMWLLTGVLALITFILTLKTKDYVPKEKSFSLDKFKVVIKHKSFLYVCFLALLVSFIKFSTSGANMLTFFKVEYNLSPILLAYMDTVFALPQLLAGILAGTYFASKFGIKKTMSLSFLLASIFYLSALLVDNVYIIYVLYSLNGFFYGGVYNLLISMAMQYFDKEYRSISMGIYQAFFAFGIYFGDYIYVIIARNLKNGIFIFGQNRAIFLVVFLLTIFSYIMVRLKVKDLE